MNEQSKAEPPRSVCFRAVLVFAGIVGAYLVVAYVVLPLAWKRYTHAHPSVDEVPNITLAPDGIPGDPLNVGLVGSAEEVMQAMVAAKWYPADPLTLKQLLEIRSSAAKR